MEMGKIPSNATIPTQDVADLRAKDALPATPRQRISINRATPYVLTSTWQNINFGNNSTLDGSTFPAPGRYDFTNLKFIANPDMTAEQQYYIQMYMKFSHKQRPVNIEFRYLVPRPAAEGGDFLFPFPDTDKAVVIAKPQKVYTGNIVGTSLSLTEDVNPYTDHVTRTDLLPIGAALKAYGAKLQMRTQETITTAANRPRLVDCYAFIIPA